MSTAAPGVPGSDPSSAESASAGTTTDGGGRGPARLLGGRLILGLVGLVGGLYGGYLLLESQQDDALVSVVAWLVGGVLVHDVSGLHSGVNPVSDDLSTGAEGRRIRGGEPAEPLREFTIASTLPRLLRDVVAVGSDLTWLPAGAAGVTLVVADVTVSGA